jgi:hypothetical protein
MSHLDRHLGFTGLLISGALGCGDPARADLCGRCVSQLSADPAPADPAPVASPTLEPAVSPQRPQAGLATGPAGPELVAMAREIQREIECIRGRRFERDPALGFQSLEDFGVFIDAQLEREARSGKTARQERLLHALGIMKPEIRLDPIVRKATLDQAAAYYDSDSDTFYVVQEMPDLILRTVLAHELQHALQDQTTPLLDRAIHDGFETFDQEIAVRFLIEGEATLVGNAWALSGIGGSLLGELAPRICILPGRPPAGPVDLFWESARELMVAPAQQTRQDMQNPGLMAELLTRAVSPSMSDTMAKLKELPEFVFHSLTLPYTQGGATVFYVLERAQWRWEAIDALFAEPPESTEQVLHPHKLVRRETFFRPELPEPASAGGWVHDRVDRVGELGLRILLMEHGVPETQAIADATGWNGDAVRISARGAELAFTWEIVWDTVEDAGKFRAHIPLILRSRHADSVIDGDLDALASSAPSAGEVRFRWLDEAGQVRYGTAKWWDRTLQLSDGWDHSVGAGSTR